jgi:hypothetical protein
MESWKRNDIFSKRKRLWRNGQGRSLGSHVKMGTKQCEQGFLHAPTKPPFTQPPLHWQPCQQQELLREHLLQASLMRKWKASQVTNLLHLSETSITGPRMKMISKKLMLSPRHKLTTPLTSPETNSSSAQNNLNEMAKRPKLAHYQPVCPCPWLQKPHPELGSNLKQLKTKLQNCSLPLPGTQ